MKSLQTTFTLHPFISAFVIVTLGVLSISFIPDFLASEPFSRKMVKSVVRTVIALSLLVMLLKLGWGKKAGITQPIGKWGKYWWLVMLPPLIVGVLNLFSTKWDKFNIDAPGLAGWLFNNVSIGLFEEVLLRGTCFYILYRAWGHTRSGIFKAAIAQALIFGLFHLMNLRSHVALDVIAQVIYATLLGVGFAGIMVYTKSIWTVVFIHFFIDATGTLNSFFVPDFTRVPNTVGSFIVVIILIFVIVTLPGLQCLRKAQLNEPETSQNEE